MPRVSDPILHVAAERFVDAALKADHSLFTPGEPIWTLAHLDDFYERFVEQGIETSEPFDVKLKSQLEGVSAETAQLAGELLFVHVLATQNIGAKKKRELVETALDCSPTPVGVPPDLLPALDHGMAGTGPGIMLARYHMVSFLLQVVRNWKRLPAEARVSALADPWVFRRFMFDQECYKAGTQRESLLYFVHPEYFEPMATKHDKTRIIEVFSDATTERYEDRDRQIYAIRESLTPRYGERFNFYSPAVVSIWKPYQGWSQFVFWAKKFHAWPGFNEAERDYKLDFAEKLSQLVKAIQEGDADWIPALKKTIGSVNISQWRSNARLIEWCEAEPERARDALLDLWTGSGAPAARLGEFLLVWGDPKRGSRIRTAAMLLMACDPTQDPPFAIRSFNRAFLLTGHTKPASDADDETIYAHAMGFLDRFIEEGREQSLRIEDRLEAQGLVWSLVNWDEDFGPFQSWSENEQAAFLAFRGAPEVDPVDGGEDNGNGPDPSDPIAFLANDLLLDRSFFATAVQLLRDKGQVIFYGPPGTGKTFVARRLAETLAGSPDRVALVQFHPSYAYEDFVEGYRPSDAAGASGFALESGPLLRIAQEARDHPDDRYVLVVDEINRGNVAKVFGELYFLLEYRDEDINLQYSRDPFSLPKNLWIIGTMNTADRSIALMDAALRRRFYFLPFFPTEHPVQGLLRRWLERHQPKMLWVAEAMDRANRELNDPHFSIGPSYFMKRDLNREWVETIWEHSVLPYLHERYFGADDQLDRFKLDVLLGEADEDLEEPEGEPAEEEVDSGA